MLVMSPPSSSSSSSTFCSVLQLWLWCSKAPCWKQLLLSLCFLMLTNGWFGEPRFWNPTITIVLIDSKGVKAREGPHQIFWISLYVNVRIGEHQPSSWVRWSPAGWGWRWAGGSCLVWVRTPTWSHSLLTWLPAARLYISLLYVNCDPNLTPVTWDNTFTLL